MRQLQDNPDVTGNQRLIKTYKEKLTEMTKMLQEEMAENQTFSVFTNKVKVGLEEQHEYEKIRKEEKELAQQLKTIQEDLKKQQDEFAKEA